MNVIYFFFALGIGYFLLDSEPHFIGASVLAIPAALIIGGLMASNIGASIDFCTSGHPACDSRVRFTIPLIGFFAAQSFVVAVILVVWWRFAKSDQHPDKP